MLVSYSFDQRFVNLIEKIRAQYGEEMLELAGIGAKDLDINRYSKSFFSDKLSTAADATIDANANVSDKSVNSWQSELRKPIMKLNAYYQLWKDAEKKHGIKRANKMIESDINGAIRLHDSHFYNLPYCYGFTLSKLVMEGMPFYDKIKIGPIRHFDSFINLSLQFLCYASNNLAGAVAFPDFLVYAEYFIRKDYGEKWYEDQTVVTKINQLFQNWIFSVNFSWRSNQSAFTNISVYDDPWINALFSGHLNPDYSTCNITNLKRVQKMFVDELVRCRKDNPFTFPVMTACFLIDKETKEFKDQEFLDYISEVNAKSGIFNIYTSDTADSLSSCCRLRSGISKAKEYNNSFGVGGLSIGSHRVVTINFPRIAYMSESWEDFMKNLEYRVKLCQDILDLHRENIARLINAKRLPLYNYGFMDLKNQYSTVGFIGLNEALELMGFDIKEETGYKKAIEALALITKLNDERTAKDGNIRNVEQIPGESAASNFAKKDAILFSEADKKYKLYSNQYIPLTATASMTDRIIAQGRFDQAESTSGGSILHINVESELDSDQMKALIEYVAKQGVVYWAMNYGFSICKTCGKMYIGNLDKSPCHDAGCKHMTRVVGFYVMVDSWSKERREEFNHRQFYGRDTLAASA